MRGKRERESYPWSVGLGEIGGGAELAQEVEAGMALGGMSNIDGGGGGGGAGR